MSLIRPSSNLGASIFLINCVLGAQSGSLDDAGQIQKQGSNEKKASNDNAIAIKATNNDVANTVADPHDTVAGATHVDQVGNAATGTTVWWTPTTVTTDTIGTATTPKDKDSKATTTGVSYNQWGFTGSQRVWESTSASDITINSVTSNSSASVGRKIPFVGEKDYSAKKIILFSGMLVVAATFSTL